jgi:probable addiction module antidote protein
MKHTKLRGGDEHIFSASSLARASADSPTFITLDNCSLQATSKAMFEVRQMAPETTRWDAAEHLDSPEAIAAYIDAAMEDGDPAIISAVLGDVARAIGMTQFARETGMSRESLYRALSAEGRPEFATVAKVMKAIGLRLSAVPAG